MSAFSVIQTLFEQDVRLKLSGDGASLTVPAGSISPEQRTLVMSHKAEILEFLVEARKTTTALIEAAMLACDHFNDSPANRDLMRVECLATPTHLQADLLNHFTKTYGAKP